MEEERKYTQEEINRKKAELREEVVLQALGCNAFAILLPTGVGKTAMACQVILEEAENAASEGKRYSALVLVPRRTLLRNWQRDVLKLFDPRYTNSSLAGVDLDEAMRSAQGDAKTIFDSINLICYRRIQSKKDFERELKQMSFDRVIFDEAQSISKTVIDAAPELKAKKALLLTATLPRSTDGELTAHGREIVRTVEKCWGGGEMMSSISMGFNEAAKRGYISRPEIFFHELSLDSVTGTDIALTISKGAADEIREKVEMSADVREVIDYWSSDKAPDEAIEMTVKGSLRNTNRIANILTSKESAKLMQAEQNNTDESQIVAIKNRRDSLGSARKRMLGEAKTKYVEKLVNEFVSRGLRTVVFCTSIKQARELASKCCPKGFSANEMIIHSKMGNATRTKNLDRYNDGECPLLFAVNMLDMGANLEDTDRFINIQVGASVIESLQRLGRATRKVGSQFINITIKGDDGSDKYDKSQDETYEAVFYKAAGFPDDYVKHADVTDSDSVKPALPEDNPKYWNMASREWKERLLSKLPMADSSENEKLSEFIESERDFAVATENGFMIRGDIREVQKTDNPGEYLLTIRADRRFDGMSNYEHNYEQYKILYSAKNAPECTNSVISGRIFSGYDVDSVVMDNNHLGMDFSEPLVATLTDIIEDKRGKSARIQVHMPDGCEFPAVIKDFPDEKIKVGSNILLSGHMTVANKNSAGEKINITITKWRGKMIQLPGFQEDTSRDEKESIKSTTREVCNTSLSGKVINVKQKPDGMVSMLLSKQDKTTFIATLYNRDINGNPLVSEDELKQMKGMNFINMPVISECSQDCSGGVKMSMERFVEECLLSAARNSSLKKKSWTIIGKAVRLDDGSLMIRAHDGFSVYVERLFSRIEEGTKVVLSGIPTISGRKILFGGPETNVMQIGVADIKNLLTKGNVIRDQKDVIFQHLH